MKKGLRVIISLLVVSVICLSCSSNPEEKLIGKWVGLEGQEFLEFFDSGKFNGKLLDNESRIIQIEGTYFAEGENLNLTRKRYPITCKFKISNKELIVTYINGAEIKLNNSMAKFTKK